MLVSLQSPDLNPTEHLCKNLEESVRLVYTTIIKIPKGNIFWKNSDDLSGAIREESVLMLCWNES